MRILVAALIGLAVGALVPPLVVLSIEEADRVLWED